MTKLDTDWAVGLCRVLRAAILIKSVALLMLFWCGAAFATSYYVSNSGADGNSGTSVSTPWKTLAKVNGTTFAAGDTIYLQRGGVWNEQLIPSSSGSAGNPISFDAYGTGPAPILTPVTASISAWTLNSGNIYTATLSTGIGSPQINNLQLGSVWGRKRGANPACTSAGVILGYGDFCVVYPTLYLYTPTGKLPSDYGSIVPVVGQASGLAVISIVGKSWLTFQHIKVQNFDYVGVSVTGASDNLVFANMEVDGMVPYGTTPLGFYVNVTSGYGTSIQFVNDDALLNYDGFRIDSATAVTITNCRAYANRDTGLKDNTPGANHVTYSYSHFYGNNVAQFPTADVVGGIAGSGNVSSAIAPVVTNFNTYPARFSFTVDDVGSAPGTEAYINTFLSMLTARSNPGSNPPIYFNAAVVPSYSVDWASVNAWYGAGNEIDSHSWSHQYYTTNTNPQNATPYPNAPALDIRYTGSGTAATLSISGNVLTTNVTGAPSDNLSISLVSAPYNTMAGLESYLASVADYSVSYDQSGPLVRPNTHTSNLLTVASQNIKGTTLVLLYDQTKLEPDEMSASQAAMQSNVSGLSEKFYVYPDGIEDPTIEAAAVAAGYTAARGSLAMKGQDNTTNTANSLYSNGVNVQNITSLGAIQIHGWSQAQVNQVVASLVFRAVAWGVPYGFFTHWNSRGDGTADISNTELGYLLDAVTANGGVWMTNMALANAVTATPAQNISGTTRYVQGPSGAAVNLAVAGANSPTVGRGVATAYAIDLNGVNRATLGAWDIGASAYLSQRYGTGAGSGTTLVGGWPVARAAGYPEMPTVWVDGNEATDHLIYTPPQYELNLGTQSWVAGPPTGCTFHLPYWTVGAPTNSGLQSAINDVEACRTAGGGVNGFYVDIPPAVYSSNAGIVIPQTNSAAATAFIILRSTQDANLPNGQTVCSHGIQDNLATATDPGLDNPFCNGTNMTYQLGSVVTPIPAGVFALANGNVVNTAGFNDVQYLWTVESTGTNSAIQFCNASGTGTSPLCGTNIGADHWVVEDAEVRASVGNKNAMFILSTSGGQNLVSQIPTHLHFKRMWAHGDWGATAAGLATGSNSTSSAFLLSCIYCSLIDSSVSQILRPGGESHGVSYGMAGQVKVAHNWIEGGSIGSLTGGQGVTAPTPPNWVTGQDMQFARNRFTYPNGWLGQSPVAANANPNWSNSFSLVRKNGIEVKSGQRIVRYGNIVENVDNSGAQEGVYADLNTWNSSGGGQGSHYQSTITDIYDADNIYRNSCDGLDVTAHGDGSSGGTAFGGGRITFANDLFYNASVSNPGCANADSRGHQFGSYVAQWQGTVTRNAAGTIATFVATCATSQSGNCPAGPPAIGMQQTDINVGDNVAITGCTQDATLNTPSGVLWGTVTQPLLGPPALAGTQPNGLTVVYASVGTANSSDTSGNCTLTYVQGFPYSLQYIHNTFITDVNYSFNSPNEKRTGAVPNYAMNALFRDSITLGGGWYNSSVGEGTNSEVFNYDTSSMTADHMVWPGQTAASYTEYGNNPKFSDSAGCTGPGCSPPATWYFPANSYCATGVSSSCVGFVGATGTTGSPIAAMPLTLADYHGFALAPGSSFYAGGSQDASDGTSMGANIAGIDAAQTMTTFVCPYSCVGPGPYPDE